MEKNPSTAKRIAVIGPESIGKSTLVKKLGAYYGEPYVEEYGRYYLEQINRPYEKEDLLKIAQGMQKWENEAMQKADRFVFCDTDLIMMKIWYEHKYGDCHPWVLKQLEVNPYDFYLLCYPDLLWEPDPVRENPEIRNQLYHLYLNELKNRKLEYAIIRGSGESRLEMARRVIKLFFD